MTTNNEQRITNEDFIDNFTKNLDSYTRQYSIDQENIESDINLRKTVIKLTNKLAGIENVTSEHALIGICALLQVGAYLKSVANRKIKISGTEFNKKNLIFAAEQIECKYTLRTIARYLKCIIAVIAYKNDIPGHLYSRFKLENANLIAQNDPNKNKMFSVYCTDFQIENPETPPPIREFLANREKFRNYKKK